MPSENESQETTQRRHPKLGLHNDWEPTLDGQSN